MLCLVGLLILLVTRESQPEPQPRQSPLVPALYVFGDSLLDSGNNNRLLTLARADFLPYGVNFPKGPTGRFTNGKTVADFIADYLGLPYPPPYTSLLESNPTTGYNYASGSCGILPQTGAEFGFCLNLELQIRMFESTIKKQLSSTLKDPREVSEHLAKSILIFSVGNNDYINTYFGPLSLLTNILYSPQQFAQLLVHKLSQQLQKLYEIGARKIVVFELGPIGCIPSFVIRQVKEGCDKEKNEIVSTYNEKLGLMLKNLTSTLQGSYFILGKANSLGYDAVINPELKPCSSPNTRYFWDGYHLTEATYSVIASHCINGSDVCLPDSIHPLICKDE